MLQKLLLVVQRSSLPLRRELKIIFLSRLRRVITLLPLLNKVLVWR